MVERFERFTHVIFEITRCWHKLASEEMEKYGLNGSSAVYLVTIHRNINGITAAQLCELSGRDKADVSRAVSALEQKGLIRRVGSGTTLYRALLTLTSEGKQAAEHVCRRASLAVECASRGYSDTERNTFWQVLDTIADNLQTLSKEGIPHD